MKNVILIVAVIMGMSAMAQERGNRNPEEKIDKVLEKMDKHLDLTSTQESQIRSILEDGMEEIKAIGEQNEAMREEMKEAKENSNGDREALREEMKEIKERYSADIEEAKEARKLILKEQEQEILAVLTSEQEERFAEMKEKRKSKIKNKKKRK